MIVLFNDFLERRRYMKPKKQGQEQAMFNYLDANAKKIIKNVDVLSLILGSLVEDFKEMDEGQLKAYLAPIQNNVKNFSPQVQMQSTELFIGKNKCCLLYTSPSPRD